MKILNIVLVVIVLFSTQIFAAKTGTISGHITDKTTGDPLADANVIVKNTKLGASTDNNGFYEIKNVPVGKYTLQIRMRGYTTVSVTDVIVRKNKNIKINMSLRYSTTAAEEVIVTAKSAIESKEMSKSNNSILKLLSRSRPKKEAGMKLDGANFYMPTTEQPFNTEEYSRIVENDFYEALKKPLSTFSIDVDAASYSNTRRFLMQGQLPPKDAVRIEEFVNYFDYDYPEPTKNEPFSIYLEYSECPWNKENNIVHIGLKGKKIKKDHQLQNNLVFLLDVSGSMQSPNKLPLLKKAFRLLVNELKSNDLVSIVVYAGAAGLVLPPSPGKEKDKIFEAIENLRAGGSTAGGAGIQLAYKTAKENHLVEGNNRIILATDGDFNVGVSSSSELIRMVEEKRKEGIFLTILGFGMGNIKDNRLEQLADKGNGNYAYIDNILEAKKVLVNEIGATLFTIAKDVKIQVEFNPANIKSYRLVGYENRLLNDQDFEDDAKDAGEIGAGHTVTALYEVVPADSRTDTYDLKYQQTKIKKNSAFSNEILTVKIRYKQPDEDKSTEIVNVLKGQPTKITKATNTYKFSVAVAEFAMILRNSQFKKDASLNDVTTLAKSALGEDLYGYRAEFLRLVDTAELLLQQ